MFLSVIEQVRHADNCLFRPASSDKLFTKESSKKEMHTKPAEREVGKARMNYHCAECDKDYNLTTTEILRHKHAHANQK